MASCTHAAFHLEALRRQRIIDRTVALRRQREKEKHDGMRDAGTQTELPLTGTSRSSSSENRGGSRIGSQYQSMSLDSGRSYSSSQSRNSSTSYSWEGKCSRVSEKSRKEAATSVSAVTSSQTASRQQSRQHTDNGSIDSRKRVRSADSHSTRYSSSRSTSKSTGRGSKEGRRSKTMSPGKHAPNPSHPCTRED